MDLGLVDRVFVVTAACCGLGRACARQLVAEGARVVVVARRAELVHEVVAECGEHVAAALPADLSAADTAGRACAVALERWGRLDGALVSVGGPPAGSALGNSEAEWHAALDSVLLAALRVTRTVVEKGTAADLALAWVLSTSVKSPVGGLAVSNGLRPGLGMLLKQAADELGPQGTRLVGLLPGRIATERVAHLDSLAADPAQARRQAEAAIPLRRYGDPEEFAKVAAFVLSPAASYLTGCTIPVEGGALRCL